MDTLQTIEEIIKTSPLTLLTIKDEEIIGYINNYLPFSTGIEIECYKSSFYNIESFKNLPYIMEVIVDSSEQRYRIPNGFAGIICLYLLCEQLKHESILNLGSGIHYHIDCTEGFAVLNPELHSRYILKELDSWGYTGTYNTRKVGNSHNWVRIQSYFRTLEFRIGEMSFDYEVLLKRIKHCQEIIRRIKELQGIEVKPDFQEIDLNIIKTYTDSPTSSEAFRMLDLLKNKIQSDQREKREITDASIDMEEALKNISNRVTKNSQTKKENPKKNN